MAQGRQNVVVIVMDTARYRDVFPSETTVAPTLESLAESGMRFDSAISPAPWTVPSHASLFTGTYPSKHGAHAAHKRLDDRLTTLPAAFSDAGYETVAVSNNTWISEEFGFGDGFDEFQKTWQYVQSETDLGRIARTTEGSAKYLALGRELFTGNPVVNLANTVYGQFFRKQNDSGAKRTNRWIESWLTDRPSDSPFFLFVNYLEPHLEYRPPKDVARRFLPENVTYEEAMAVSQDAWAYTAGKTDHGKREFEILRALYRAEIGYLDSRIGELRDTLADHGVWEDTVFVVTSDHGENIGDHGLMDHQYSLHETVLHVPLVIHGGPFTGGQNNDELVSLTDLAQTIVETAGLDAPDLLAQSQGTSFHPDHERDSSPVFAEYLAPQPSMQALKDRVGPLPESVVQYDRSLRAIRTPTWKLIRGSDGSREWYRVDDGDEGEPHETGDSDRLDELETQLETWLESFDHAASSGDVSMTDETKDRLEDLGYLQE